MSDDQLFEVYDTMAEWFADAAFSSTYNLLYDQPVVKSLMPDVDGKVVLDAGCGPGAYVAWLLDNGARVIGVDASAEMVRMARKRFGDRVEIRRHDLAKRLEFLDDASVDVALSALMMHYLPDLRPTLAELHRVLKPNGALVVSTTHPTADWVRKGGSYFEATLEMDIWKTGGRDHEVRFWRMPLGDLTAAFADTGFAIDRLVEHRPSDEVARLDPEEHAILSSRAGFIAFLLRPRPSTW